MLVMLNTQAYYEAKPSRGSCIRHRNSINPIEVYLIAGSLDLLPSAKIVPIGKQSIKANADTMNVK